MKKKSYKYYIFFLCAVMLCGAVSGCATSGRKTSDAGSKKPVTIDRKRYRPLSELCAELNLAWEWDGFSRIVTVRDNTVSVKLYPGSMLVLHNNAVSRLDAPVQIHKGLIVVPESFTRLFSKDTVADAARPVRTDSASRFSRIVIDAGHGGKDPGAVGVGGVQEKDIVLDIAQRLKKELEQNGVTVLLTRDSDIFHPLEARADIANKAQADFFMSIHANASENGSASGFEAYYLSPDYDDFAKAVQIRENAVVKYEDQPSGASTTGLNATLWDMMLSENRIESITMANAVAGELRRIVQLKTRYVKGANFIVLKGARMPAVLLEVGYLSHPTECRQLSNPYYRQMLAEAVAAGVVRYKTEFEVNDGFTR